MKHYLIVPDTHVPAHDRSAVAAMCTYAADHPRPWDGIVFLGDFADCRPVNPHLSGKPKLKEGLRLGSDLAKAGAVYRDIVSACGAPKERHFLLGNHEDWLVQFGQRFPEISDDLPKWADIFPDCRIYPYRKNKPAMHLGKLHFLHGYGRGGATALRKWLNDFNVNLVGGHIHRKERVTKTSAHGVISAWCLGYLGAHDLGDNYLEGPANWSHGFGDLIVRPSGLFHLYDVDIVRGVAVPPWPV